MLQGFFTELSPLGDAVFTAINLIIVIVGLVIVLKWWDDKNNTK
jgi:hypothetical protein